MCQDSDVVDNISTDGARTDTKSPAARPAFECGDLELTRPATITTSEHGVLALVRVHGCPVGSVQVGAAQRHRDGGRELALLELGEQIDEHLTGDGLSRADLSGPSVCRQGPTPSDALVSVVVCTTGEDPRLRRAVESVLAQTYAGLELVVVDNRPQVGRVAELLDGLVDPRLRTIREPCRGLSAARNAGMAAARGSIIAFTDDDAVADPHWVSWLAGAFVDEPAAVAVTGLVVPSELTTPAQWWFEEFGAFDKGHARTWWSLERGATDPSRCRAGDRGPLFPYAAGTYGSGNNMAFRAEWLRASGQFDEALGAGSLSRGGEDLDAFLTVVLSGAGLLYEPAAVVRHAARRSMTELASQLYGYGSGNSAAITKHLLRSPGAAVTILRKVPAGLRRMVDPGSEKNSGRSSDYPAELARGELRGFLLGPVLYLRARRDARARRRRYPAAHAVAVPIGGSRLSGS